MLSHFGRSICPNCATDLVHTYDMANDWVPPGELANQEPRWLCPDCGYSRSIVYTVERSNRSPSRTARGVRPLLSRLQPSHRSSAPPARVWSSSPPRRT